ncbi:MAG: Rrf2 family transcriptional regulator [Deltaproteobacteria bacterium]|nr:Rrf2 family transcriptional regulator [Deltaproteobacteria bacterium]MBW2201675.1 Rrf2 family transcriptional regulator [Deltaproteobacteria bacterium]
MKLSTRSRYGARMMLELARHYERGPVSLTEISKTQGISKKYLEQITIPLKKANYIKSVRGVSGGHVLAKPPDEIKLGEIVAVLEGSKSIVRCEVNNELCKHIEDCVMHPIWEKSEKAIFDYLASISMADLLKMDDSRGKKTKINPENRKGGPSKDKITSRNRP